MLIRNSHGLDESILLAVANDPLKNALAQIVGEHRYVMDARYDVIAGTTGSLAVVKKLLPGKRFVDLGHGPDWGDIAAITFMIGQLAAGHRFEALVLFHPEVERHEPYKLALLLSLIKADAVWWPTSASAQAFYASLTSPDIGSERPSPRSAVQNGYL